MPGERTPRNVPIIPEADIVALSTSVSNHWSRKSMALIVISWTWLYLSSLVRPWKRLPRNNSFINSRGLSVLGSGGTMLRIGFTKRHMACMALPNSS